MFQTFFTKTIESKFIKNLLYNTPLPTYSVVKDNTYIVEGIYYIYQDMVIYCTLSGYLNPTEGTEEADTPATFRKVSDYTFGADDPLYTERYISEFGYYDSETHEQLGKYLRCYKNMYNIDLMPFYNCYSSKTADNFYIKTEYVELELTREIEFLALSTKWTYDEDLKLYYVVFNSPYSVSKINSVTCSEITISKYELETNSLYIYTATNPSEDCTIIINYTYTADKPQYSLLNNINSNYKVIQIPIKFNQTYTIAVDTECEMLVMPAIIRNGRFVVIYNEDKTEIDLTTLLNKKAVMYNKSKFKRPFTFKVDLVDEMRDATAEAKAKKKSNAFHLAVNERNLYLLIQVPAIDTSSVVVLEGDYTIDPFCTKHYDGDSLYDFTEEEKNKLFLSPLSLLKINDHNHYAFSNRLIEYLTLNVINPIDEIDNNIKQVQDAVYLKGMPNITYGVWTDFIRSYYYKLMMDNTKIEHYDLNGYIDKDTEKQYVK